MTFSSAFVTVMFLYSPRTVPCAIAASVRTVTSIPGLSPFLKSPSRTGSTLSEDRQGGSVGRLLKSNALGMFLNAKESLDKGTLQ